ncbi:hypothetical protein [Bacillus phage vB_BanS-Thrax5]|nr:hypothetical protein [Bacillus phage vB_BanS-Thrax5]
MKYIAYALKLTVMLIISAFLLFLPLGIADALISIENVSFPLGAVLCGLGIFLMAVFASWTVDKGW